MPGKRSLPVNTILDQTGSTSGRIDRAGKRYGDETIPNENLYTNKQSIPHQPLIVFDGLIQNIPAKILKDDGASTNIISKQFYTRTLRSSSRLKQALKSVIRTKDRMKITVKSSRIVELKLKRINMIQILF